MGNDRPFPTITINGKPVKIVPDTLEFSCPDSDDIDPGAVIDTTKGTTDGVVEFEIQFENPKCETCRWFVGGIKKFTGYWEGEEQYSEYSECRKYAPDAKYGFPTAHNDLFCGKHSDFDSDNVEIDPGTLRTTREFERALMRFEKPDVSMWQCNDGTVLRKKDIVSTRKNHGILEYVYNGVAMLLINADDGSLNIVNLEDDPIEFVNNHKVGEK